MSKKSPKKRSHEPSLAESLGLPSLDGSRSRSVDKLPEVALAAIASSKKQKDVSVFINFLLNALERHSKWVNSVVSKQNDFRCALMVGAGPNRFQMQETFYPSDKPDTKFEIELKDSEDYDKVAIAAILKLSNSQLIYLTEYLKNRLQDNYALEKDLKRGKELGINFAVLRPISGKQYRLTDRIVVGGVSRSTRNREDTSLSPVPLKRAKRIIV